MSDNLLKMSRDTAGDLVDPRSLWIVVPAYNEGSVIGATLAGLFKYMPHVLVVDDGSTDETASVARTCGARVISHIVNLGQGAALQTGIDAALGLGAGSICTFDADGQHDPTVIDRLLEKRTATNADVVLASRFLSTETNFPVARKMLLKAAVRFTRWQTGLPLTDTHNGLRLLGREAAMKIRIRQNGMAHASEILCEISKVGLSFAEVPTNIAYTSYSMSKGQSVFDSARILFDIVYAAWSR